MTAVLRGLGVFVCSVTLTHTGALLSGCGTTGEASTGVDAGADGHNRTGDASLGSGDSARDGSNGMKLGGNDAAGDATGTKMLLDAAFRCDGCPAFPPSSTPSCSPTTLGRPILAYPPDGVLLPPNMNVLEVQWVPPSVGSATLYEVDFSNGATDVRVESGCAEITSVRGVANTGCGLTLSQAQWNDIAHTNAGGDPVRVTVRAMSLSGSCVSSTSSINISFAQQNLSGGIYYWQSATYGGVGGETGGIYSHDFGTFDPTPTPFYTAGATGTCVGCHNVSRDGVQMALTTDDPDGDDEFGDEFPHVLNVPTRTVTGGSHGSPGFQTFTHDHALMVASTFKTDKNQGFDVSTGDGATLLGTSSPLSASQLSAGLLVTQPDLSADDESIVFVVPGAGPSGSCSMGGGMMTAGASCVSSQGDTHFFAGSLYGSTFSASAARAGMNPFTTTGPLLASDGTRNYYYPSFSPDGHFIGLNDAPQPGNTATTNNDAFYNRGARVKLLHYPPAAGATPIDLPALNVADGLTNSWPRWSPFVQQYKGHQVLWVTFSSNRDYGLRLLNTGFDNCYPPEGPAYDQPQPLSKQNTTYTGCAQPQIWMAAVIVDTGTALDATDRSFPAFWLPFQDVNSHNHSAQWVAQIQGGPGSDGGMSTGGDSGPSTGDGGTGPDGAGMCGAEGATCGSSSALCCSDVVCCEGTCSNGSNCIK